MSLTQIQMEALRKEIAPLIEGLVVDEFSESRPKHFVLMLGQQQLLLCLQSPFLRFHLLHYPERGEQSPFAKKINAILSGLQLKSVEVVNEDRILKLTFSGKQHSFFLIAEFFPKRPNLYLIDQQMQVLEALYPISSKSYQTPQKPIKTMEQSELLSNALIEKFYRDKEQEALFQQEKQQFQKELIKRQKRFQKALENGKQSLASCLDWEKVHHEALLLQSHLYRLKKGMCEVVIPDWENENKERKIVLDPLVEPYEEIAKRFRKSKKLRAGIEHAYRMIKKAESELQQHTDTLEKLSTIHTLRELHHFQKQIGISKKEGGTTKVLKEKKLPYREFCSAAGLSIWVGKSARDNDVMTFSYAKGSDWWLHVRDFSGSHVVVRCAKNQEPDQESLKDAMQLALSYSKAKKQGEADICVTQCKYVVRFGKGKAGKVHISKHQVIHIRHDPARLLRLKER